MPVFANRHRIGPWTNEAISKGCDCLIRNRCQT
jgi:hypothetical protein